MNTHHIYMWSSEEDMVRERLGLSRLAKFVKPGVVLYMVLSVSVSTHVHLRIYNGLSSALLDISANTFLKVPVMLPKAQMKTLDQHLKLNGEEWQGLFHGMSGQLHADFLQMERIGKLLHIYSPTWSSLLKKDLSAIFDVDSFPSLPVTLRVLSMDCTYLQDVLLRLPLKADLSGFMNFVNFSLYPQEFKELLQEIDIFPGS